jgi:hypothetical protein
MPFKSQAQRAYLYQHHPEMAKRWSAEYPNQWHLPEHVKRVTDALVAQRKGKS